MSIVTLNDRGVRSVTTFGSVSGGSMVFIKKLTASSSSDLSFVNGSSDVVLDSTYKEYVFTFKNIHAGTDGAELTVGFRDGSTDYDATKTTTVFEAYHNEAGDDSGLAYQTAEDIAQGTGFQNISKNLGTDNDQNAGGYLHLFNPSSTTFVKHFISRLNNYQHNEYSLDYYVAGYCNVTTAIDAVQFKMSSGNIDSGDICLYGIL
tara:strand:- start:6 stop:620 length:615 start_codon:yes stop_codon:yes gene_type:complete